MQFGKSYYESCMDEQKDLACLYQKKYTSYAWFPTKMSDGSWVWLEDYSWKYNITKNRHGRYFWGDAFGPKFKYKIQKGTA